MTVFPSSTPVVTPTWERASSQALSLARKKMRGLDRFTTSAANLRADGRNPGERGREYCCDRPREGAREQERHCGSGPQRAPAWPAALEGRSNHFSCGSSHHGGPCRDHLGDL